MKKTLLAAALIVGFAGVAQAETSVTLYGILDTGYGYENYKYDFNGADKTVKASGLRDGTFNGSRWGMKGAEDLGNGLRAIFQIEARVNLGGASVAETGFNRQSFVGLSSDSWGTFTMGRQYSAGVDTNLAVNGVNMGDMDRIFGSTGLSGGTRVNNSFKYVTPSFSGFKGVLLYGTGTDADGTVIERSAGMDAIRDRGARVSAGVSYANGPISAGASYDRQSVTDGTAGNPQPDAMTNWQINGSYDFEVVKLSLAYGQDRDGKIGWAGGAGNFITGLADSTRAFEDTKFNNYHVGLSAPVGGGTLYAGWNYSTSNLDDSDKLGDSADNISTYHINYLYPLSKRTSVYTYATYGKNLGYLKDLKGTEAGLGLNHKF